MTTPSGPEPAIVAPRRRGFGTTSLVLGILLIAGVAVWLVLGSVLFPALVWVFPILVLGAFLIAAIHLVVAAIALVLSVLDTPGTIV